jgi:hypothetical protein
MRSSSAAAAAPASLPATVSSPSTSSACGDQRAHVNDLGGPKADARDIMHAVVHLALDRRHGESSWVVHRRLLVRRRADLRPNHCDVVAKANQYGLQASGGAANRRWARRVVLGGSPKV